MENSLLSASFAVLKLLWIPPYIMLTFIIAILLFILWQIASLLLRVQFESAIRDHEFERAAFLERFLKSDESIIPIKHLLQQLNNKHLHHESPQLIKAPKEQIILIEALAQRVGDWHQVIDDYNLLTKKKAKKMYRKLNDIAHQELEKINHLGNKS